EDAIRRQTFEAQEQFKEQFFDASRARREALLAAGEADPNSDALTLLLAHLDDVQYAFDDGLLLREVATYVQGGAHTSAQTLVNAIDLVRSVDADGSMLARIATDRSFAQRVV